MELKRYFSLLRRWAWLLILGAALGATSSLAVSLRIKPTYEATTKVLTTRAGQGSGSSSDVTYINDQALTQTYIQLASSDSLRQAVAEQLGQPVITGRISVQQVGTTQIIEITVDNKDPELAANIANTLVQVLIAKNDELQSGRYTTMEESLLAQKSQMETQIASLQTQIDQTSVQTVEQQKQWLEEQIKSLQAEILQLQNEIAIAMPTTNAEVETVNGKKATLSQLQSQLGSYKQIYTNLLVSGEPLSGNNEGASLSSSLSLLKTTQNLYRQIYLSILSNLEQVRLARLQDTPNVVQIDPALAPTKPVRPRPLLNTVLSGIAGLVIAAGGVLLKEYLDDTLKTPEDVEQVTGLPVIGYIAEIQSDGENGEGLFVAKQPRSPVAEAFRSLRTNLEFAGVDKPLKTIIVTSPGPGEGKTTVASNLAAIISQGGKRVVLLDTDLRRPRVHQTLGISNRVGLSDVFRGHLSLPEVMQAVGDSKGLSVITSGSLPPNPSELLGSSKMFQVLEELQRLTDVVIIDSPPSLVTDAQVMASKVDGVLMVIHPGYTRIEPAKATIEQLKRVGANVVGAVLNRIPHERSGYYGGHYSYYSHYDKSYHYYSEEGRKGKQRR